MTVVIAAAPGPWLAPLLDAPRTADVLDVWSPLAAPAWLGRAPGALGRFARRRSAPAGGSAKRAPALLALDGVLRAWAGERADRRYLADFGLRSAIDLWAAAEVRRTRPRVVIACSLAARRTFAAARAIGARTVLVLDLPLLRALHRDLDRAAAAWPDRAFLQRFRAPSWAIARQEAERVLADEILVRGAYARRLCLEDGIAAARLAPLPALAPRAVVPPAAPTHRLRLAGLAAARHGIDTALAVARLLGKTLVVRPGEGTEPADLTAQPGVTVDDGPVDAIVCPAICETYPAELQVTGIPVIASAMASRDGEGPDPFDPHAFAAAVAAACGSA